MKAHLFSYLAAGVVLAAAAGTAQAQVSLSVGTPGFYGAIDIGGAPPPALVYQQPMLIQPGVAVAADPLYLYVPANQYGNWGQYCGYYDACNRPVFFVQSSWYQRSYVPYYRSHRSYYEGRRAQFQYDRHSYRPPARNDRRMAPPPPRPNSRPPAVEQRRAAPPPPPRPNSRPPAKVEHRSGPDNRHHP
ncbi:MAG: hypothetical protein FWG56_02275 [Desulfovibrionaceae bacterium]|nr:hypothetical protein [Desulfovibrionaceae bacterium]